LRANLPPDDFPVTQISHDMATNYAEMLGKRLMHEAEYEVAATRGGRSRFPSGDSPPPIDRWELQPVKALKWDQTPHAPPVRGLFSNALEWTSSWEAPYPGAAGVIERELAANRRVIRGGPSAAIEGNAESGSWKSGPRDRFGAMFFEVHA